MLNSTTFLAYVRRAPFGGKLTAAQIAGMEAILQEWDRRRLNDHRWLAYMLATAFHETGGAMQPVRENLNYTTAERIRATWPSRFPTLDSARPYVRQPKALAIKVYGGRLGNAPAPSEDGWIYRGDGLPQITGREHFETFGVKPGMDLITSVRVMFDGMTRGLYTGRKLADYFGPRSSDPEGARAVVNGTDKAKLIATHYRAFYAAIGAASELTPQPADVEPEDAKPDDKPIAQSGSAIAIGTVTAGGCVTAAGGVATAAIGGISNQWALIAFGLLLLFLLIAGGVGAYLVATGRLAILRGKAAA